jgi:hypothetical protein
MMLSLALLALAQPPAEERSTAPPELPPTGSEIFRGLLDLNDIQPYRRTGRGVAFPIAPNVLTIVYGNPNGREQTISPTVLNSHSIVAIRGPYELTRLMPGVREIITATAYETGNDRYTPEALPDGQRERCPFVGPPISLTRFLNPNDRDAGNPFTGFPRVAAYRPSSIRSAMIGKLEAGRPYFGPIAVLPPGSRDRTTRTAPENDEHFAVSSRVAIDQWLQLQTIVMASETPFSNRLIALEGTDNLAFANKLIKGFKDRGVTHCAFYDHGVLIDRFDDVKFRLSPATPPIPIPPPQIIDQLGTQIANQLIDQLDKTNAPDNLIRDRPLWLGRFIAFALGGLIALGTWNLIRRAWGQRHRPDLRPMPIHPFGNVKMAAGLIGQLQRDVIVGGDYGPVVRDYLRDFFLACGLDPQYDNDLPPPIRYDGKRENAPAIAQDLHAAWKVSRGDGRISLTDWKQFEPKIVKLWKAARAGKWRFVS